MRTRLLSSLCLGGLALLAPVVTAAAAAATFPNERVRLADPTANPGLFGDSTDVGGGRVIVGNPFDESASGAFVYDAWTGQPIATLQHPTAATGTNFGDEVALAGNIAVVAQYQATVSGQSNAGAVHVFSATSGAFQRTLTAPTPTAQQYFGWSIDAAGNSAVVGAPGTRNPALFGVDHGAAYVYDLTTGQRTRTLTAPDAATADFFGESVALSASRVLVGATSADVGGTYDTGAAYLYNASTGALVSKLLAPDRAEDDIFGAAVALSDNYALVGAYGDADHGQQTGAAYLFNAQTGAFIRKLTAPDGHADSIFGWSVAVNDDLSIVSAGKQNTAAGTSAGAVYIFDNDSGALLKEVFASDPAAFERFGIGLSADDETLAVGAPGGQFNATGAAYIIGIPEPTAAIALLLLAGCAALRRGMRGRRS